MDTIFDNVETRLISLRHDIKLLDYLSNGSAIGMKSARVFDLVIVQVLLARE